MAASGVPFLCSILGDAWDFFVYRYLENILFDAGNQLSAFHVDQNGISCGNLTA